MARFCASCGTACEAGASFCNQCGHALKKPAARSAATAAPASQARAPVDGPPPARSGTRRLPWALGLGLTLVVAVGGGVGGWMYYDSQRAPNAAAPITIAAGTTVLATFQVTTPTAAPSAPPSPSLASI